MMALFTALAPVADDIRELRGPIEIPAGPPWGLLAAITAGAILLALGVVALVRRHRRRRLPPHRQALHALEAARTNIEAADPGGFSTRVSDAVRRYVEQAFALHAPRLTTEELLARLMTAESPVAAHRGALGAFLECCDLAKYARWSLTRAEMTRMLDTAETFVRETAGGAA